MRRDALENAQDAQAAAELRRELREAKAANRELAEVVARLQRVFRAAKAIVDERLSPVLPECLGDTEEPLDLEEELVAAVREFEKGGAE